MGDISRKAFENLLIWKNNPKRKVLLIRGARQVGKTYLARKLGREFKNFIEINLVEQANLKSVFETGNLDPNKILESISAYFAQSIEDGQTLLFIDEIQACPEAITALRFFYEKRPNLHVLATGSLLEFALEEISSFGVGRVEYLYLYPLSFNEFLISQGEDSLIEEIKKAKPLAEVLHLKALSLLKLFLQLGGLPEVHVLYASSRDLLLCSRLMSTLLANYEDDFSKYKKRLSVEALAETLRSTSLQTGKKFIYSHAYRDAKVKTVSKALSLLVKAGLVHQVFHSSANGIPLGAELDTGKFKVIPLDIGIFNRLSGLQISDLAMLNALDLINKGALVEMFVGLEIINSGDNSCKESLYYWHREAKSSNAELDYILQVGQKIVPIEVKASSKGSMQSMHAFIKEKKIKLGIRTSTENFSEYDKIKVVPLYAISEIRRIIDSES